MNIKDNCNQLRSTIKDIADKTKALMKHDVFNGEQTEQGQHSEMFANIMLSYRALEDAGMRLGKVIQHSETGLSCFDKGCPKCGRRMTQHVRLIEDSPENRTAAEGLGILLPVTCTLFVCGPCNYRETETKKA